MQVKALYNFTAEEDDELGFSAGDIIEVLDRSDPSWWKGRLRGRSGLFPANYTIQQWENTPGDALSIHIHRRALQVHQPSICVFEHEHWAVTDSSNLCTACLYQDAGAQRTVTQLMHQIIFTCILPLWFYWNKCCCIYLQRSRDAPTGSS